MNKRQYEQYGRVTLTALQYATRCEDHAYRMRSVVAGTRTRPLRSIAIVGAGINGSGIAMTFTELDLPVTLLDKRQSALDGALASIRDTWAKNSRKGNLSIEESQRRAGLIRGTLDYDDIRDADLVIEAVYEERDIKEEVFQRLDRVLKPGAILATSTSTLDVDAIAAATNRPEDVLGLHFFSPVHKMPLLQLVRGEKTSDDALATIVELGKALNKLVVVSNAGNGLIGNRLLDQYWRQALFLIDEGCAPEHIDKVMEAWGMAMGPFRMMDMVGNDLHWAIRRRHYIEHPHMRYSRIADKLCELGRFGQKSGAGWYRYKPLENTAFPDSAVQALIRNHRSEIGGVDREIADEEIVDRLVYALINEGARILEGDPTLGASDIDTVYVAGYGFPRHKGGPMFHADTVGIAATVNAMRDFAMQGCGDPSFWIPAARLVRCAETGSPLTA